MRAAGEWEAGEFNGDRQHSGERRTTCGARCFWYAGKKTEDARVGRWSHAATGQNFMDEEAGQEWVDPSDGHQTAGGKGTASLDLIYITISNGY